MLSTVALFAILLLFAMLIEPLAERLKLPFSSFLVIVGFVGSELIVMMGFDTGLRWYEFVDIILHLLVPIIIFESAFNANFKALIGNLPAVLFLAVPAMLCAALLTGLLIFWGIGSADHFPLLTALLAGVILSATDPVAVVAIFKKLGAPDRLNALLEGESLFNDVTVIVVYSILVSVSLNPEVDLTMTDATLIFTQSLVGGVLVGVVIAYVARYLYGWCSGHFRHTLLGIIAAIISFYVAEHWLSVSGVVAVLSAGLVLGEFCRKKPQGDHLFAAEFWELNAYIANAILFILVGVTVTVSMFSSQWLAMLVGIGAATVVRFAVVYGLFPIFCLLPKVEPCDKHYKQVLMWGGLRGAVSLALALSIPVEIEGWYTVQSIVYAVVIFTLFVQAPFMDRLVMKTIK